MISSSLLSIPRFASAPLLAACALFSSTLCAEERPPTFCNPLDLPYRFSLADNKYAKGKSFREAADPTLIFHDGTFWLFASKCGGYFRSKDLLHWDFIQPEGFPVEEYAPAVRVVGDTWVMTASIGKAIFVTKDPSSGKWTKLRDFPYRADPELFVDDDGRVYFYWGSSPDQPIFGQELDPKKDYEPIGQPVTLIPGLDTLKHGWEARNQFDSDEQIRNLRNKPWMEGSSMIKHDGVYYLQYSAPATELPIYADGIYTATKPLGPYTYAPYSPFSYKPTGFASSAAHGCTVEADGRYWRAVTSLIGVTFMFERRLSIYPAAFLPNGSEPAQITVNTYLGDYPQIAPMLVKDPLHDNLAGWMLLSLKKPATASSTLDDKHKVELAFDEDMRTAWAAASDKPGEWLQVDFGKPCRIDSVQVNFADVNSTGYGFQEDAYRYLIEVSDDGKTWKPLVDRRENERNAPHEYIQLSKPVTARYAKLTNSHTPAGAVFSVSGLRFFGSGLGKAPAKVSGVKAEREENRRLMKVSWDKVPGADFYIVRYGIKPDRLTLNWQVYDGESITLPGLNTDQEYFVTVDAVNDTGVTKGGDAQLAK